MTEPDPAPTRCACGPGSSGGATSYLLNGTKLYITNAPVADVVLVFAVRSGPAQVAGISAFLVEKGTPGFTVSQRPGQDGPADLADGRGRADRLPRPGREPAGAGRARGWPSSTPRWTWERSCILASAVGAMQRQLEACVDYARYASSSASPSASSRRVAGKMADMYLRLEAARLLVYQAAWLGQQGKPALAEAAAAKLFTSEAWVASSLDAIQIARRLRLHEGKRHRARPAGRGRQHHLLRHLGDPAGDPGPDAGPLSQASRRGKQKEGMAYLLQHLLTEARRGAPQRPAVAAESSLLTYAELDKLSNQVARALLAQGVAPGDRVGILAPKSAASVVAVYGVLKAGACYVPLDPKSPAARLATIMADSGIAVVLAGPGDRAPGGRAGRQRSSACAP